jgi:hypothetical protein
MAISSVHVTASMGTGAIAVTLGGLPSVAMACDIPRMLIRGTCPHVVW